MVAHEYYPGVHDPDELFDLWRHPLTIGKRPPATWEGLLRGVETFREPVQCITTGPLGPRETSRAITLFTYAADEIIDLALEPRTSLSWSQPLCSVQSGPTLWVDGPSDMLLDLQRALREVILASECTWEGPLTSMASSQRDQRVLYKGYLKPHATDLEVDLAIAALRGHTSLCHFVVGDQRLFADPAALKVEVTSLSTLPIINTHMDQAVLVSPRLLLMTTSKSQDMWLQLLTGMQRDTPDEMVRRVSWRGNRHGQQTWAIPQALPSRVSADQVNARRRRRPAGAASYLQQILVITVVGGLGPEPDSLLLLIVDKISSLLGRPVTQGGDPGNLQPDEFHEYRGGDGVWAGSLRLRITDVEEAKHTHALLHGAVADIAGAFAPVSCYSPLVDGSPQPPAAPQGNGGGGN